MERLKAIGIDSMENLGEVLDNLGDVIVKGKNPRLTYKGRLTTNLEPEDENDNNTYVFFVGIPYGMPPIGDRRLRPPEPYQTTETMYEALTCKPISKQYDSTNKVAIGSEDCLYLNIYLPQIPNKTLFRKLLPVLVYFHGGGMSRGDGNYETLTPDSIMKEDIILVTVNYRLGMVGFLNMHYKTCQGNQGLKDQVLALRWVQDNIKAFGGNPKNVTICGQSAGGSCVNLHLISPLSEGLFHKAIIMSGGIYSPWGFTGHHRELMLDYKECVDSITSSREIVVKMMERTCSDCLIDIDNQMVAKKLNTAYAAPIHLGASVETSAEGAFLPPCADLKDLIDEAKPVPILAGICKKEGYMMIHEEDMGWVKDKEKFIRYLMVNLRWYRESAERQVDAIWQKYFPNMSTITDRDLKERFADFCTDLWFYNFYDNFEFKRNKNKSVEPFYVYLFDFFDEISYSSRISGGPTGADHGDDIEFLFCPFTVRANFMPFSEGVKRKVKTMCQLWASFCKSSVPKTTLHDVKWRPHTDELQCYLHIGNDKVEMKSGELFRARWDNLRNIIKAEPVIPSLAVTPMTLTPGCYETPQEDFEKALQAKLAATSKAAEESEPGPSEDSEMKLFEHIGLI